MSSKDENSQNNILKYDAFISYRHCELDQYVAVTLHKKLESFKLPKSVLSKVKGDKTKLTRVFRDEDELTLSENLSEPIDQALSNSEFLIVICTPRLSQSRWCLKEIEDFLKTHDRKHILLVLAEGEPEESFPEILRYEEVEVTDEAGNTHTLRRDVEPLAADVRGENKKEIAKAIDGAVIKLAAAMFGLNYDDLKQRHREQKLRKLFAVWSVITVAILIFAFVCLGLFAVILNQRNDIKERYAGTVADAASGLLEDGRRKDAIYVLRTVLDAKEPYNADAYRQMTKALDLYAIGEDYIPLRSFSIPSLISDFKLSMNNRYMVVGGYNGEYHVFDMIEEQDIYSFESTQGGYSYFNYGFDGETGIIYTSGENVIYADFQTQSEKKLYESCANIITDVNCDITSILVDNKFLGYKNGELVYETDIKQSVSEVDCLGCTRYSYSPDGKHVLLLAINDDASWILQFNTETGEMEFVDEVDNYLNSAYATDGKNVYITRLNYSGDRPPIDSTLCIIDIDHVNDMQTVNIPLVYASDVVFCDTGICIMSYTSAIMLDKIDYSILDREDGLGGIVGAFQHKSGVGIVEVNSSFHRIDGDYISGMNTSEDLFGIVPKSRVNKVIFQNDKFYYCFADNYIVEYGDNPRAVKQAEPYREFAYSDDLWTGVRAEDILESIPDINPAYVYSSVYSNDKKHIAVMMCDKVLRIYNADTYELEKIEYGVDNDMLLSFVYIEEADIYILNTGLYAYILDSEFNYISDIDYCVGFEDGCFIVVNHAQYYKIKLLTFEEILQLADEELEGYTPDQAIMDKYILKYKIK